MRYRLVLWDFDGTLADTGADVWDSLNYAAACCGARLPEEFTADNANLSKSVSDIFRYLIPFPGDEAYETFNADVAAHYRALNDFAHTRLYSGVLPLIGALRRNRVRNVIVTNKPCQALERLLHIKGWGSLFDGWITPDWISSDCPHEQTTGEMSKTAMIAKMIALYNAAPGNCVYVGDTWSDVQSAHANGIDCIAVTYGDGDVVKLHEQRPEYCVNSVDEVAAVLLAADTNDAPAVSVLEREVA